MSSKVARRALLFVPGDDEHKIRKAAALKVDAVILDLEDGVALGRKNAARQMSRAALLDDTIDFGETERLVRLNTQVSGLRAADLEATMDGHPDGYVLPKVETAHDVHVISDEIRSHERRLSIPLNNTRLILIIETALGIVNLPKLAWADQRVDAIAFGAEDLAASMGAKRTAAGAETVYARGAIMIHAAAASLQAIDTPYINFTDHDGLRTETEHVRDLGFTGKFAIHPAQVPIITEVFTPSADEIAYARALIEAFERHDQSGKGVFAFDGKMIDQPMITQALRVLERAEA